jgi:hypothetical protein
MFGIWSLINDFNETWAWLLKSKYNNWLIAKLINVFADVKERSKEKKESLALRSVSMEFHQSFMGIRYADVVPY